MVESSKKSINEEVKLLDLPPQITAGNLSSIMSVSPSDVIKELMRHGVMANINQFVEFEIAVVIAHSFGFKVLKPKLNEHKISPDPKSLSLEEDAVTRCPIVAILGHVDHGKTSILDAIRGSKIAAAEFGGITQSIGAYQVVHKNEKITFIDTPGHEAFTAMRARGAQITDIAVLVVAVNDGVMKQTEEAIDHIKAAKTPMIVVINKCDLPNSDINRVKAQLVEHEVVPEEYGGDVMCIETSAISMKGIDDLLESITLLGQVLELKASKDVSGRGFVLEGSVDKHRGSLGTVLVKEGMVSVGNFIVAGDSIGKIKDLTDGFGRSVKNVSPGAPAQIMGLNSVPKAGDFFRTFKTDKEAKIFLKSSAKPKQSSKTMTYAKDLNETEEDIFRIIVKCGTDGALDAVKKILETLEVKDKVNIEITHASSGTVNENDVMLASAANAVIVGFQCQIEQGAIRQSKANKILIKRYDIVYEMVDDLSEIILQNKKKEPEERTLGTAQILEIFSVGKIKVAGGFRVTDGIMRRNGFVKIIRGEDLLHQGSISSLRHLKENVRELKSGMEGGLTLDGFNDFEKGDLLECFEIITT